MRPQRQIHHGDPAGRAVGQSRWLDDAGARDTTTLQAPELRWDTVTEDFDSEIIGIAPTRIKIVGIYGRGGRLAWRTGDDDYVDFAVGDGNPSAGIPKIEYTDGTWDLTFETPKPGRGTLPAHVVIAVRGLSDSQVVRASATIPIREKALALAEMNILADRAPTAFDIGIKGQVWRRPPGDPAALSAHADPDELTVNTPDTVTSELIAVGGVPPYTWAKTSGEAWATVSQATLRVAPPAGTTSDDYDIELQVTDSSGTTADVTVTVIVVGSNLYGFGSRSLLRIDLDGSTTTIGIAPVAGSSPRALVGFGDNYLYATINELWWFTEMSSTGIAGATSIIPPGYSHGSRLLAWLGLSHHFQVAGLEYDGSGTAYLLIVHSSGQLRLSSFDINASTGAISNPSTVTMNVSIEGSGGLARDGTTYYAGVGKRLVRITNLSSGTATLVSGTLPGDDDIDSIEILDGELYITRSDDLWHSSSLSDIGSATKIADIDGGQINSLAAIDL